MNCFEASGTILITVSEALGSTPRDAGTSMCVSAETTSGTIGGGALEWRAIEHARELLAGVDLPDRLELPLGPTLAQCCGGRVTLTFAPSAIAQTPGHLGRALHIYGAGHVGLACMRTLTGLPFDIKAYDQRSEAQDRARELGIKVVQDYEPIAGHGDFHLVMTHDHALDLEIVAKLLTANEFGYLGLIGSATKRARFEKQLRARGLSPERLTCPIGIKGINGKEPAVIAASVTSQLLMAAEALDARSRNKQLITAPE